MADEPKAAPAEGEAKESPIPEDTNFDLRDPELVQAFKEAYDIPVEEPDRSRTNELLASVAPKTEAPQELDEGKVVEAKPSEQPKQEPAAEEPDSDELVKWKKMFGESQNAVGELRREVEALKGAKQAEANAESTKQMEDPNYWGNQLYGKETWDSLMSDDTAKETRDFYKTEVMAKKRMMELVADAVNQRDQRFAQVLQQQQASQELAAAGLDKSSMEALEQKYPWVSDLPDFSKVAAMKDLAAREQRQGSTAQSTQPRTPTPVNADHIVEAEQASAPIVTNTDDALLGAFSKIDDPRERNDILGDLVVDNNIFGNWV